MPQAPKQPTRQSATPSAAARPCRYRGDYLGVYGSFLQLSLRHIAEADWSGRIPEYNLKHFRLEINKRCGSRRSARRNAAHHLSRFAPHNGNMAWRIPEYNTT